jgi:hypothetical protein
VTEDEFMRLTDDGRKYELVDGEPKEAPTNSEHVVWHLFPESQTVRVFSSPSESIDLGPDDTIDCPDLLPGFTARVSGLFDAGL